MPYSFVWLYLIRCVFTCSIFFDSNIKRFLSVLVVFGKYFVFTKIVKFQKQCYPVWRLSRRLIQSHTPVPSPHRDFSWLTGGSMSQSRKIFRIFFKFWVFKCFSRLSLVTCSRVEGLLARESWAEPWKSLCTPSHWTFHSQTSRQNQHASSRL